MKVGLIIWPHVCLDLEASGGLETLSLYTFEVLNKMGVEARLFAKKVIGYREGVRSLTPIFLDINSIYYLRFILENLDSDAFIGFNAPKVALFFPHKTIISFGNLLNLPYYNFILIKNRYKNVNFTFVSKFLLKEFAKKYPEIPTDKCHIVYPGVDTMKFAPSVEYQSNDCKKILFASQWIKGKGIFYFLKAAKILESRRKDFRILLAGGRDLWKVEGLLNERKNTEKIIKNWVEKMKTTEILGTIPHKEMPILLRSVDIFVFPSIWQEPFGIVNIEAMSSGLPVVATRVGGVPEIVINNETGLLVEPGDPDALADAIEYLLDNESIARKMGENGRKRIENMFSLDIYAEKLISILKEVSNASSSSNHASLT